MIHESAESSREDRLIEVLLRFMEAREAGREPDRAAFLAAHPGLHDDLAGFFASHDEVERLTSPLRVWNGAGAIPLDSSIRDFDPQTPRPHSDLGRLGDFILHREVGRGGMAVVYEAEQISLRRRVALKVLPFAAAIDQRQLQRFKNEAAAAAHLRHESIVPVYAVGCERGVHYYAMQFVDGQSLAALIAELRLPADHSPAGVQETAGEATSPVALLSTERSSGAKSFFDWVARQGRQAALALEHAHQTGVVHRDIKPANLLLDRHDQIWIADFGLAQVRGDSGLTATGELLGTLRYASPEQALGRRGVVDHRSDVYSLGATLYELLTLSPPFDGIDRHHLLQQIVDEAPRSLRSLNPAIPESLETIVLKALRKEPNDRYVTAQELADDLQRFLDRRPILARPPRLIERLRMWGRRHPAAIMACTAALICVTIGSLLSAVFIKAEQERTRAQQRRAEEACIREGQRADEAEARLALARRAVDELFRISEEEAADRPGMEMLRKRLLLSALAYYRELLGELRDTPGAHDELLDASHRVEKILADLDIVRDATRFYLLCQPVVHDDLQLGSRQRLAMAELTARVGRQWRESLQDVGLVSPSELGHRAIVQARANELDLNAILDPPQQVRLRQIGLQSDGACAFRDPEVVAALELTLDQRERIRVIEHDAAFGWMRSLSPGRPEGQFAPSGVREKRSTNERLLAVLTDAQARKWREMIGKPVDGLLIPFGPPHPPDLSTTVSDNVPTTP